MKYISENLEAILGICGFIVAALAFAVTIWHGWVARRHNRLSVVPHLDQRTNTNISNDGVDLLFIVSNNGIGPAIIKSFVVYIDGKPIGTADDNPVVEAVKRCISQGIRYRVKRDSTLGKGSSLKASDEIVVCEIHFEAKKQSDAYELKKFFDRARLKIEYESFYGQRFVFDTDD